MTLVLDCSVTMAWLMPDEGDAGVSELLDRVVSDGAVVPRHWRLECANSLIVAQRRARVDLDFVRAALADLARLPIITDDETESRAWLETLDVAHDRQLSAYDAAYLELAARRSLPLATLDRRLRTAAEAHGVTVLPE